MQGVLNQYVLTDEQIRIDAMSFSLEVFGITLDPPRTRRLPHGRGVGWSRRGVGRSKTEQVGVVETRGSRRIIMVYAGFADL